MSATGSITEVIGEDVGATAGVSGRSLWRRLRHDPVVLVALCVLVLVVLAAVFAPLLAPYDPLKNDLPSALQSPSADHLLGTDELGRDVLSRLLYGARLSLIASSLAIGVAFGIGFPLGLLVGYRGGRLDSVAMRISDGLMALPALIVVLALISIFGNSLVFAMVALGIVLVPVFLRLTRGVALNIRTEPYIDAARVLALPSGRIVRRHLLPHVLPSLIVQTSFMLGVALLVEAGLSFIGLGIQPPHASWGAMLSKAAASLRRQPFVIFPPGVAITLTVLALNVVGDGVRDAVGRVERAPKRAPRSAARPAVRAPLVGDGLAIDPAAALDIRDLTVGFPIGGRMTPVVAGVSLSVGKGEVVGLVGESGCGKTVTGLTAIGLIDPPGQILDGSVRVGGIELVGRRERELCRLRGDEVAMVFQDPSSSLDPAHTVGDQVGESLRLHRGLSHREARERAIDLLVQVGIADPARRVSAYPHEFSGGMAQRVAIASALACDPKLLIADEPTTALDVTVQAEILELLRKLQAERDMAILFVTHDLGVVADLCQRAVVMYAGEVVEEATVSDLFADPQHPYTAALLDSLPRNEHKGGRLPTIAGKVPQPGTWGTGCHFADRCTWVTDACREHPVPELATGDGTRVRCILAHDREEALV